MTTVHTVKSKVKILQNFVAFSEYMNFTYENHKVRYSWLKLVLFVFLSRKRLHAIDTLFPCLNFLQNSYNEYKEMKKKSWLKIDDKLILHFWRKPAMHQEKGQKRSHPSQPTKKQITYMKGMKLPKEVVGRSHRPH